MNAASKSRRRGRPRHKSHALPPAKHARVIRLGLAIVGNDSDVKNARTGLLLGQPGMRNLYEIWLEGQIEIAIREAVFRVEPFAMELELLRRGADTPAVADRVRHLGLFTLDSWRPQENFRDQGTRRRVYKKDSTHCSGTNDAERTRKRLSNVRNTLRKQLSEEVARFRSTPKNTEYHRLLAEAFANDRCEILALACSRYVEHGHNRQ